MSKIAKTKTQKVKRLVSNRYSLVDIPSHTAGVENGAWDVFFFYFATKSNIS